jgi:hypothetical protein
VPSASQSQVRDDGHLPDVAFPHQHRHEASAIRQRWGGPVAADSNDSGASKPNTEPRNPSEMQFGDPPMSWEEATRQGDRRLTEADWEAAVKDTEENSSPMHYYPDRPDDPAVGP